VLDPFFGTGTTGAVARRMGRHFVGIEREEAYIEAALARISAVEPARGATLSVTTGKRAEPRVAFGALVEMGFVKAGAALTDARRRWRALVRLDGSLECDGVTGSIHGVGAKVQGLDACNGWTFWHVEDREDLTPLDAVRQTYREQVLVAGA